ncbi:LysR family transcriptional regulator [Thiohalomonas denitrificans]|uniref:LysR family transcriptional regulator n=1 Tax=Thiohalomonas denitrificans TaxID=415747 RepID=UPI0026F086C6|nr:LysR family transcriptional regulator [Thiohalomonas denitrificans]
MDIPNLQAFLAVSDAESFSRAATRLHLTQPAVSKRVAALEEEMGAALFDRVGHHIVLTEAGRALLPNARKVLEAVENGRRAVLKLSGTVAGRLSIGTSHHIGLHRLPPALRRFLTRYPGVKLDLRFMDSEQACRAVETGELELAVVTLPPAPAPGLLARTIWDDPLAIVASREHPLTTVPTPTPSDLTVHPAVLPARGTYTRQTVERALLPLGLELNVELSTNYLETIRMLVSVGLGWSVLPATMIGSDLATIAIPELQLERQLGLVCHRARTLSNAASAFAAELDKGDETAEIAKVR